MLRRRMKCACEHTSRPVATSVERMHRLIHSFFHVILEMPYPLQIAEKGCDESPA